ncbi:DUF7344 domain-containing protein [Halobaculum rarum]|uniref:DUF7344 domain-containing protein n=1 Tax=Halobaculum rarum TaxID=3075122 RepID=UPI0032AED576
MNRGGHQITTDTALRLLSDRQRREVLRRLTGADEPVTVESLTASLATTATGADTVRLQLVHNHLPKLHDAEVIDYDPEDRTVRRGPGFDAVASLLQAVIPRREDGHEPDQSGSE